MYKFIETFFFISLVITFILLSLLFYHFKQRLIDVEQKSCRVFEIIENLVKEISFLKCSLINSNQSMYEPPRNEDHMIKSSSSSSSPFDYGFSKLLVSDDSDNESDDESSDSGSSVSSDSNHHESDDDTDTNTSLPNNVTLPTSVIMVQMSPNIQVSDVIHDVEVTVQETNEHLDNISVTDLSEIQSNQMYENLIESSTFSKMSEELSLLAKLDQVTIDLTTNPETEIAKSLVEELSSEVKASSHHDQLSKYQKYSMKELKALAAAKGISIDPAKHKKQELIQMIFL